MAARKALKTPSGVVIVETPGALWFEQLAAWKRGAGHLPYPVGHVRFFGLEAGDTALDTESAEYRAGLVEVAGEGGWTFGELAKAFEAVAPKENWKYPIAAEVGVEAFGPETLSLVARAVTFFTGSVVRVKPVAGGKAMVKAAGYYAAVGA